MINTNSRFLGWQQYSVAYNMSFTYTKERSYIFICDVSLFLRHELHEYVKPLYSTVASFWASRFW